MKIEIQAHDLTEEWQQLALAAAIVERMSPNFVLFNELAGLNNADKFSNIINLVWEFISGKNQRIDFAKQREKLELITPDPSSYDMYGVRPALDAAVGLACLLGVCERWDQEELDSLSLLSLSTINQYLELVGEEDESHPLYQAEQAFSHHMSDLIKTTTALGRVAAVKAIRSALAEIDESNIGIEWLR